VVGRLAPDGSEAEIFAVLPSGSRGNGSRIDASGRLFIADYKKHNVLVIEKGERKAKVHFHSDLFSQPNDLALSKNGTLFASDPNWAEKTGRIWRIGIDQKGQVLHVSRTMGTTNGLDLSPDESKLYVSESIRREVWSYDLSPVGELKNPHLLIRFSDASIDGLRTDIDGNIFVARIEKGTIAQLNLTGVQIREIKLKGREPSNLAFGGADGKTVFVTQNDGRRIESFKVERPGREWCMLHAVSPDCKLK
jgi:sugar lactone lactonase YvrE